MQPNPRESPFRAVIGGRGPARWGRQLGLLGQLLGAIFVVMTPQLALTLWSFVEEGRLLERTVQQAQVAAADGLSRNLEDAFDGAFDIGRAVATNPLVLEMDPTRLDPLLQELVRSVSRVSAINVFDARGANRGWGDTRTPAEPRLDISDRPFFVEAITKQKEVLSPVLRLRRPVIAGMVAAVPLPEGRGVVNVLVDIAKLTKSLLGTSPVSNAAVLAVDPTGRLAFHSAIPNLPYEQSEAYASFEPVLQATAGKPSQLVDTIDPLREGRFLSTFWRTPKYGWVVGVTVPRDLALRQVRADLWQRLLVWGLTAACCVVVSIALARSLANRVRRLEKHVQAIQRGELQHRADLRTGDELERLGSAFDALAEHLQTQEDRLRRAQRALVLRERMAASGELAAGVAHEVRNPLAVIQNAVTLLSTHRDPQHQGDLLRVIREESDRINELVGELIDYARPRRLEPVATDMVALVRSSVGACLAEVGPRIVREEFDPQTPPARVDPRLLRQALVNLVRNALQASGPEGHVTVRLCVEPKASGALLRIEVADNGPGIPERIRERLFEPFVSTKAVGIGLGLALVKRTADEHSGSVSVTTGAETCFILRLPLDGPTPPEPG